MSINGIGTAGYPLTGYTARKMERSVEPGTVGFMERCYIMAIYKDYGGINNGCERTNQQDSGGNLKKS